MDKATGEAKLRALTPTTGLTLQNLPAELRLQIFKYCLRWNGRTPTLLSVFRGYRDQILYHEAMMVFNQVNSFKLSGRNNWGLRYKNQSKGKNGKVNERKPLPDDTTAAILNLTIVVAERVPIEAHAKYHYQYRYSRIPMKSIEEEFPKVANLHELSLIGEWYWIGSMGEPMSRILWPFKTLRKLTIHLPFPMNDTWKRDNPENGSNQLKLQILEDQFVAKLNFETGVRGRTVLAKSIGHIFLARKDWEDWPHEWVWEAENGKVLRQVDRPQYPRTKMTLMAQIAASTRLETGLDGEPIPY